MAEELMDEKYFSLELLKRINSSCSMGAREKKCEWDEETINEAASQGNLEMVKYCVANKCHIDEWACAYAALKVISSASNTYAKKQAPWDSLVLDFARTYKHLECLRYATKRNVRDGQIS